MTSYDTVRAFVRSGARLVCGRDGCLRAAGRAAHRRDPRVVQLMRRVGIFLLQKITPAIACIAGARLIPFLYSDVSPDGFFASSASSEKRAVTRP